MRLPKVSTHNLACSIDAGKWLYGDHNFVVFKNAIDTEKFSFNQMSRTTLRDKLSIENDDIIVGHVGRFDTQKNHDFLIDVFAVLVDCNKRFKLALIGEGKLKKNIVEKVKQYNIENNVMFLGQKEDVYLYYNLFDMFVLPSLFEGLGIVAIEAQNNGLPCVLSDRVPCEAVLTDSTYRIRLDKALWVDKITSIDLKRNKKGCEEVKKEGYDIKTEAHRLEDYYLLLNNSKS